MDQASSLPSKPRELRHTKRPVLNVDKLEHKLQKCLFYVEYVFSVFLALECY